MDTIKEHANKHNRGVLKRESFSGYESIIIFKNKFKRKGAFTHSKKSGILFLSNVTEKKKCRNQKATTVIFKCGHYFSILG